ncbi:hypothetical protein LTR36_001567 [Oleoguttula mirabilis]|uniref:Mid2 domain-containing protein n=1 Tax=Oleoguttula mirabilis TaxID=1507867 RepID=A0AAV9JNG6_9PEZI|nr:hypothetical protein LTR36_001567 [Oleoguttula mirabilis]
MRTFVHRTLLLLPSVLIGAIADSNSFTYPPSNGETLYVPSGTALTIQWNCSYDNMNLRVFQQRADASYDYNTILSDLPNTAGPGSYAWVAEALDSSSTSGMHFEVTLSSNDQSVDPFNSGYFYITNGSALSTSGAPVATTASSTSTSSATAIATAATSSTSSSATSTSSTASIAASNSSAASAAASTSSSSSVQSNDQSTMKLGLGLGLGLGIPLLLIVASLLGYRLLKRRRQYGSVEPHAEENLPPTHYKDQSQEQIHEVDGSHAVFEAPSEGAHEAPGPDVRYEMSAERDKS